MWYRYPWTWQMAAAPGSNPNEPVVALVVNVATSSDTRPKVTLMVDGQTFSTSMDHVRTMDMFE